MPNEFSTYLPDLTVQPTLCLFAYFNVHGVLSRLRGDSSAIGILLLDTNELPLPYALCVAELQKEAQLAKNVRKSVMLSTGHRGAIAWPRLGLTIASAWPVEIGATFSLLGVLTPIFRASSLTRGKVAPGPPSSPGRKRAVAGMLVILR